MSGEGGSCLRVVVHEPCLMLILLDYVTTVQSIASVRLGALRQRVQVGAPSGTERFFFY